MTFMKKEERVLKTDGMGRVRTPKERREALLDEFERSGLSGVKFAGLAGIKYQTFAAWAKRRREERAGGNAAAKSVSSSITPVRWLEAEVASPARSVSSSVITLVVALPGGARMEISDASQAALAGVLLKSLQTQPTLPC